MRIKLIPLLVIKRKQRHCLFNQNLSLDNNDYPIIITDYIDIGRNEPAPERIVIIQIVR